MDGFWQTDIQGSCSDLVITKTDTWRKKRCNGSRLSQIEVPAQSCSERPIETLVSEQYRLSCSGTGHCCLHTELNTSEQNTQGNYHQTNKRNP